MDFAAEAGFGFVDFIKYVRCEDAAAHDCKVGWGIFVLNPFCDVCDFVGVLFDFFTVDYSVCGCV